MELNRPFFLKPSSKDYLWGGRRLNDEFAKNIDMYPLAETWECSTHPDGPSFVANGEFTGRSLKDILSEHPDFIGTHPMATYDMCRYGELPILIKFIDASQDLSVQVHPDDEYAWQHENGQLGKSEMWYVLDARKGAGIVYGLSHTTDKEVIRDSIKNGTVGKYLQKVKAEKDDVFFIEAGTIHAIGAGILVAEIQENSNLTYRMYDYDRVDKNGRKRKLDVDKAMDVADLRGASEPRQPIRVLRYSPGMARELLMRCKYFEVNRMIVNTERRRQVVFKADKMSYRVLLCINGCGTLKYDNEALNIYKGDCLFVPADSVEINIHGQMQFLDVRS